MMLAGLAVGVVGSRLIPPVAGILNGSRRVRAGGDPFGILIADHRKIQSILRDMANAHSRLARGRLFLMLKRKLSKHAMAEEDVVYPIVHQKAGEPERSKHLYDEHADMKILLYELEQRVMKGQNWSDAVARLQDVVERHIQEEETQVFPNLRRQLSERGLPMVSGQISREEALIV
jgi:hemerythrin-like domain-containing protein